MESSATAPILIAYDGSDAAKSAVREAAGLLGGRPALVVTVWDPTVGYDVGTMTDDVSLAMLDAEEAEEVDDELKAGANRTAKEGSDLATSAGLQAEQQILADEGSVAEAIVDLAKKRGASAIVVGSTGKRGLLARIEGSTSKGILKHAPRPVLIVHGERAGAGTNTAEKPIIIAFDGSDAARQAIRAAGELLPGRSALVLTVWEPGLAYAAAAMPAAGEMGITPPLPAAEDVQELDKTSESHARDAAQAGVDLARSSGLEAEPLAVSDQTDVAEALVALADERDAAAIVVGSRGLTGLRARLEGSTSKGVLKRAHCPVLVVHDETASG